MILAGALLLTGCMTSHMVAYSISDAPKASGRQREGVYYVEHCDRNLKKELLSIKNRSGQPMFVKELSEEAVPLTINLGQNEEAKSSISPLRAFNNFLSACTLGIWPWISSSEKTNDVTLRTDAFVKTLDIDIIHRAWSSFLLPIGVIPVPGWADERAFNMDMLIAEDKCELPEVDYKKLAREIAENLWTADYNVALQRKMETRDEKKANELLNLYTRAIDDLLDFNAMAAKDEILRGFSLKECPEVWRTIQKLRAELSVQNDAVQELQKRFADMGRTPGNDPDYLNICKERFSIAELLKAAYASLEEAYLKSRTSESTLGGKKIEELDSDTQQNSLQESDRTRRMFEEIIREK